MQVNSTRLSLCFVWYVAVPSIDLGFAVDMRSPMQACVVSEARHIMEQLENVGKPNGRENGSAPLRAYAVLQRRVQRAEAEVCRLTRCVQLRDQQLCELRKVLAHSATMHYCAEDRLQRELDSLRIMMPADELRKQLCEPGNDASESGVVIRLPYVTSILSVLFDAMYTFWAGCDPSLPPKSSTVARAIDERLRLSAQSNGEASRSGQAFASAIRPDWVKDADNRHHCRPGAQR